MAKKILIATGIFPPDIGGPAEYAKNLFDEFLNRGYEIRVITYGIEKKLPTVIRHITYFFRVILNINNADLIIALDTFSVGLPSVLAAMIFRKKIINRIGGDFLWENYIEGGGEKITIKDFYIKKPRLSFKQKLIFLLTKFVLQNCDALVFSTDWQKKIMEENFEFNRGKAFIIENFYDKKIASFDYQKKNFVFAGRLIKLKNLENLKSAFENISKESDARLEIVSGLSQEELIEKIKNCYAVILPSLSDISPNFILDAIKLNKPFILTRETGFYDKLREVGVFIDPLSVEDIEEKVLFLSDSNNYNLYKEKLKNFNFTHSWQEIADEFLNIYKNL